MSEFDRSPSPFNLPSRTKGSLLCSQIAPLIGSIRLDHESHGHLLCARSSLPPWGVWYSRAAIHVGRVRGDRYICTIPAAGFPFPRLDPMYCALLLSAIIAPVGAQILPTSFVKPTFGQPKASIEKYTWESYQSLLSSYQKEGIGKSWVDENAWTAVAQYDLQRKKRDFYNDVRKAQDEYAGVTSDQQPWKTALVNYYNDDIGWAALSHIAAYDAYGDQIFLDRAKGAYEVGGDKVRAKAAVYPQPRVHFGRRDQDGVFEGDQESGQQDSSVV
jgi:hypothetical protein